MAKYTSGDIKRLAQIMRNKKDSNRFHVITGAGCSLSAGMPLVSTLLEEIQTKPEFKGCLSSLEECHHRDYGKVMGCLPPNERKALLSPYLDNVKINWAHIALASMMNAGYVSRVLTFNFDNVLARACGLCGLYPATYDFVSGAAPSGDHIKDPSIVHLHGQGFGLAMLNSEKETKKHARKLKPLLRETFERNPVLIIGYSGESDAVFPVIKKVFNGDDRLFWVGYRENPKKNAKALVKTAQQTSEYLGGADADQFLIDLARELKCFPPPVFDKPTDHLRNEIADVLPFSQLIDDSFDARADLEAKLKKYDDFDKCNNSASNHKTPKINASKLLLVGDYKKIIQAYEADPNSVPNHIAANAYIALAKPHNHKAIKEEDIADIEIARQFYEKATRANPKNAAAWNQLAISIGKKSEFSNDVGGYDKAASQFQIATEIEPQRSQFWNNWAGAIIKKYNILRDDSLVEEARDKIDKAIMIDANRLYYAAWLEVALGNFDKAKEFLEICRKARTLPSLNRLLKEKPLAPLREDPWFKDFIKRVKKDS